MKRQRLTLQKLWPGLCITCVGVYNSAIMDLILMFFLLALLLQGIKVFVNYLLAGSQDFKEAILTRSTEMEYVNLLSIPSSRKETGNSNFIKATSEKEFHHAAKVPDQSNAIALPKVRKF